VFSIGAIIFMWFLYPKQYDYQAQLDKGMFFYQANMVRRFRHHAASFFRLPAGSALWQPDHNWVHASLIESL